MTCCREVCACVWRCLPARFYGDFISPERVGLLGSWCLGSFGNTGQTAGLGDKGAPETRWARHSQGRD